jgi:hypothetical protein
VLRPPSSSTYMMSAKFAYVEQDHDHPSGGNELPTYDDLASQNGPNSRYVAELRFDAL